MAIQTENQRKNQIILNAEIEDPHQQISDTYQLDKVDQVVHVKDYQIDILATTGQTSVLLGLQVVTTQYLLSVGSVGLFPVTVALIPVMGSVLTTLTNLSFNGGVQVQDKDKLPGQIIRTSILAANSIKIISDLKSMEDIANKSFQIVIRQEREYRNLPEPKKLDLVVPGIVFMAFIMAIVFRKK